MNNHIGISAYKAVVNSTLVGRQLEAHVLLKAADRLQMVIDTWGSQGHEDRLRDTISRTQILWNVFQDALLKENNPIEEDIKINVLNLSMFIDRQLFAVIADPTPDRLTSIINIHRELAAGLNTKHIPATHH
jgi:flagellar protein FlaF